MYYNNKTIKVMSVYRNYQGMSFNELVWNESRFYIPRVYIASFEPRVPQYDTIYIYMYGGVVSEDLSYEKWEGRLNNEDIRSSDISKVIYDPGANITCNYKPYHTCGVDYVTKLKKSEPIRLQYTDLTFTVRGTQSMGIIDSIVASKAPIKSLTLNLLAETSDDEKWLTVAQYPEFWYTPGIAYDDADMCDWWISVTKPQMPEISPKLKIIRTLTINGFNYGGTNGVGEPMFGDALITIPNLVSLRELRIQNMPIDNGFFSVVSMLPGLSEISLNGCIRCIESEFDFGTCSIIRLGNMRGITGSFMSRLSTNVDVIILDNLLDFDYTNMRYLDGHGEGWLLLINMPIIPYNALYDAPSSLTFDIVRVNTEVEEIDGYTFIDVSNGTAPKI